MSWAIRIVKSYFSLPLWVVAWISLFLVPANFAGLFYLSTVSGFWISVLGAGAIIVNLGIVWLNGGFSKALCIPHVILWTPLVLLLGYRLLSVTMVGPELWITIAAFVINLISLFFDFYDLRQWRRGARSIAGFENETVRI